MAQIMNIAGLTPVEDPEYRYKMPRLVGKIEGRGNGIKTVIPNMTQVAQSLHRPPGEVTKFFGCELGAQTTWTEETDRAVVNGAHATQVLQDKLSGYIEKFVLCPSCRLPETSYKIKHEIIYHQCVACGARETVDMQHKLTTYILKQHKMEKKEKKGDKDDKKKKKDKDKGDDKKEEKKKKKKKDKDDDDDDEAKRKRKEEKKKKKKKEKEAAAAAEDGSGSGSDDDSGSANEADDDDAAEALESAISGLREYIRTHESEPANVISELRAVQTFCALPRSERGYIIIAACFENGQALLKQLAPKKDILVAFAKDAGVASLFGGLEKAATLRFPEVGPKLAIVLKALYDIDVLGEDEILAWHGAGLTQPEKNVHFSSDVTDVQRAAILAATEPFITWLNEAEEDDDTDED